MYKLLLCWRYLRTRYLALACVVSVMLGVATLIVVNSVMSGFSTKLKERLHGLLSDVLVEARSYDGFPDPAEKIRRIQESPAGRHVEAMTPTVETFAMAQFRWGFRGETYTKPVKLIGIDPVGRAGVGGFAEFLVRQKDADRPSFELTDEARRRQEFLYPPRPADDPLVAIPKPGEPPPVDPPPPVDFVARGAIVGYAIASFRAPREKPEDAPKDVFLLHPGDDITLTTVSAGNVLRPAIYRYAVADYFKSEMSEYDSNFVFVPLDHLQQLRAMQDRASTIQIRLKDPSKAKEVADELKKLFPDSVYSVSTWMEKQGPLLAAISIERGILNVVLFLIILVAGFGILAIFSMIVAEKTRDIGIIKSLGASTQGVLSIFLGYGLLLGVVGSSLGTALGLWITRNINEIEYALSRLTGQEIFDRSVYYFDKIPTDVQPVSVAAINLGSVLIAVVFSILPALRAASIQPVRALRYE